MEEFCRRKLILFCLPSMANVNLIFFQSRIFLWKQLVKMEQQILLGHRGYGL